MHALVDVKQVLRCLKTACRTAEGASGGIVRCVRNTHSPCVLGTSCGTKVPPSIHQDQHSRWIPQASYLDEMIGAWRFRLYLARISPPALSLCLALVLLPTHLSAASYFSPCPPASCAPPTAPLTRCSRRCPRRGMCCRMGSRSTGSHSREWLNECVGERVSEWVSE